MTKILLFILFSSCAYRGQQIEPDNLVSLNAALNQAQASYLKGCLDVIKQFKLAGNFLSCRDSAINHRKEINFIMDQNP